MTLVVAALTGPAAEAAAPQALDELAAVAPGSYPTAQIMTDDGEWIFSAEGGAMAFIYLGNAHPGNTVFPQPPLLQLQPMPSAIKRVQVGTLGVITADLALDPALDLVDDPVTLPKGTEPDAYIPPDEDYADLIYIAGGHLGLWAMEAHPVDEYMNRAVRIDNSGDLDPTTQNSNRFCTDVEVVEIEGEHFLVALFARKDDNILRVYRLQDVHSAMAAARSASGTHPDLGHESVGLATFPFGAHPFEGPDV